ncbi:LLM class flavin-dependent oxidoreductase [Janthinobacterium agaricidamnosum]|uniref:Luciferase-like monooxygenase family protein n=1 Tax=Janthinobacterium agaricidamnosum NBRC 102515 = DSM 9628 TaxID=1349767 RepID=W0V4S5_9BURK|nr:LLM class flavin-dependent oxidoreductase [Janthinobacterium agaricidamnosum]CDG82353.1 luciferase-like monooxygenase family protein [Janthinobacterium agaricidamnosum NBRC 102515 = DSM 9628]
MSIEFIGFSATQEVSETVLAKGPVVDKSYLGAVARAHEYAGFDRVLVAHGSGSVDGFQVASYIASQTEKLGILLAHRPGFVAPTLAARQLATLDHFSDGRLAVHIISGGDDTEQQRDGDFLDHDQRYSRSDEFLDVVKQTWSSSGPFDHQGRHYQIKGQNAGVRPLRGQHVPVYFGGSSDAAIEVAGKHADVYALWGESLAQVAEIIAKVRAAAAKYDRADKIRFSLSLRPVLAETEELAWAKADAILAKASASVKHNAYFSGRPQQPQNTGSQRLLATAAEGKVVDERLWTGIAALTRAAGNSTGLVGTPEQVRDALLKYWELGVTTFLIRGFDPIQDALQYGRELIPLVRAAIAERSANVQAPDATRLAA